MSRSSARSARRTRRAHRARRTNRAQTEPTTALVAVLAVVAALSLYAVVFDGVGHAEERALAETTLDRVSAEMSDDGVADPATLERTRGAAPDGYRLNLSLVVGERRWAAGPSPPANVDRAEGTDAATGRVSVRLAPGVVRTGRLRAVVWR